MRRFAFILALALSLPACNKSSSTPSGVAAASITMSVAPNPIVTVVSNPVGPVFSIRFTTTLKESAGLGVTVEEVKSDLFDDTTGILIGRTLYDDKDLVVFVGSKRVEGNAKLDVEQTISYSALAKRNGSLTVTVKMRDDKGNTIEQALLVKVT
jgi:hypothetical protein